MYWIFAIGGYLGGVPDRVLLVPDRLPRGLRASRARRRASSSRGTSPTPSRENPATGEKEDTDVGFPGPEHHIAEREAPMRIAMGVLGVLAIVAGVLQIPGVTAELEHFLEGTFEDSAFHGHGRPARLGLARACWSAPSFRSPGSGSRTSATSPGPG